MEWVLICAGVLLLFLARRHRDRGGYAGYLRSPAWQQKRQAALRRDGWRCRVCNSSRNLEVHHRRYPAVLGTESVSDLTCLCAACHQHVSVASWVPGG